MTQFLLIAHDYADALPRRMEVREQHLALGDASMQRGELIFATAMLNDAGQLCGSVMVFELPDRAALDRYLTAEPYVKNRVWEKITVQSCKVGPSFQKLMTQHWPQANSKQ
jgi:uncharacterized protein